MSRRERLERKIGKRREWSESASREADRRFGAADEIGRHIPLGQPILVGHHSEKRHRRDLDRIHTNMEKGCEALDRAEEHASKAAGLAHQLEHSIFSDDENAIQALEARIAERTAELERMKAINKEIRKGDGWEERITPPLTEKERDALVSCARFTGKAGYPSFSISNLGANIRRDKERIEQIRRRQARSEKAEASGGILVTGGEYVSVTFSEKPERTVLDALKAAGFHWSSGSWHGRRENLPPSVAEQMP